MKSLLLDERWEVTLVSLMVYGACFVFFTIVAGGAKAAAWGDDDEQALAEATDIAMSGVTFLALK